MRRGAIASAGALLAVFAPGVALATSVGAATETQIAILDNRYDPNNVAVALDPADGTARLIWTNKGAAEHTVTSKTNAWRDQGPLKPNGQFRLDIQRPGTFAYFCTIHGEAVMSGTVMVTGQGPPATTTVPPTTASTTPATTTTTQSTTTTTAPDTTTTTEETTTTSSSTSTTSTTAVALRDNDDDDDDDDSNGPLRILGVGALLAAAAGTVVQGRRFLAGV